MPNKWLRMSRPGDARIGEAPGVPLFHCFDGFCAMNWQSAPSLSRKAWSLPEAGNSSFKFSGTTLESEKHVLN